ncbi:Protein kri1 [Pleurostoma richardsiae]|uniref:Protein kri1 n=1 Tax=Pleurostoma richardsiae TaxID=41990 RepID=A0AA38S213_9PEZI|nr:Protein kri1 [Pleurostoma richardsiae]
MEPSTVAATVTKKSLFDDSDEDREDGGAELQAPALKINEDYAKKFEHNKKREEKQRLEEKYKGADDDTESSEDETEDEDAFLATEELDAEISATLQAIKNRDPRIYDKDAKFYHSLERLEEEGAQPEKKEKPVTLRDYHRERYLRGDVGADYDEVEAQPKTFVEEQADLKKSILSEINAAAGEDAGDDSDLDDIIKKKGSDGKTEAGPHPSRAKRVALAELDVDNADKDPETFLSNFMAARAWAAGEGAAWQPLEEDDDEEDNLAEQFEAAYNLRFEDPEKSNAVLRSYSRKVVEARSVRREEPTGRKKQRQLEKEQKEAEKRQRQEERARLKKLKVDEAEEKLAKIKKAAGMSGKVLKDEEWVKLLDDAWDDDKWEEEMRKRFDDQYYAERDEELEDSDDDDEEAEDDDLKKKNRKPRKPKWDDDINIKDIIPDFEDEERPKVTLTDSEGEAEEAEDTGDDEDEDDRPSKKRKTNAEHKKERQAAKRAAREERSKIEALVDARMELDDPTALATSSKNPPGGFRYRETSPNSFGLTARDILLAPSDAALNEYVGLKKLATFRDAEKKKKDKKRLGKKARLRQWRREVFGQEYERTGPTFGFAAEGAEGTSAGAEVNVAIDRRAEELNGEKKKKRKRSKGKKAAGTA